MGLKFDKRCRLVHRPASCDKRLLDCNAKEIEHRWVWARQQRQNRTNHYSEKDEREVRESAVWSCLQSVADPSPPHVAGVDLCSLYDAQDAQDWLLNEPLAFGPIPRWGRAEAKEEANARADRRSAR